MRSGSTFVDTALTLRSSLRYVPVRLPMHRAARRRTRHSADTSEITRSQSHPPWIAILARWDRVPTTMDRDPREVRSRSHAPCIAALARSGRDHHPPWVALSRPGSRSNPQWTASSRGEIAITGTMDRAPPKVMPRSHPRSVPILQPSDRDPSVHLESRPRALTPRVRRSLSDLAVSKIVRPLSQIRLPHHSLSLRARTLLEKTGGS